MTYWFTNGELDGDNRFALSTFFDSLMDEPQRFGCFRSIDGSAVLGARERLGLGERASATAVLRALGMEGWTEAHVMAHILDSCFKPGQLDRTFTELLVAKHGDEALIDPTINEELG